MHDSWKSTAVSITVSFQFSFADLLDANAFINNHGASQNLLRFTFRTFRLEQIVLVFFVEIFKLRMHQSGNTCVRAMQSVHSAVATKQNKTVINPFMLSMT